MTSSQPSLGFLLNDAARLMRRRFDRLANETGLTRAQFQLLAKVARSEGINQAGLAELLDMEPISVCRTIDRMEAAGLVTRKPDPNDRRARLIYMTDAARPALAKMQETAAEIFDELLTGFSEPERQSLLALLTRLHANASATAHQPSAPQRPVRKAV